MPTCDPLCPFGVYLAQEVIKIAPITARWARRSVAQLLRKTNAQPKTKNAASSYQHRAAKIQPLLRWRHLISPLHRHRAKAPHEESDEIMNNRDLFDGCFEKSHTASHAEQHASGHRRP